jgi:hypothetical protein
MGAAIMIAKSPDDTMPYKPMGFQQIQLLAKAN